MSICSVVRRQETTRYGVAEHSQKNFQKNKKTFKNPLTKGLGFGIIIRLSREGRRKQEKSQKKFEKGLDKDHEM